MCVDDAQWLDAESLHALAFAARRIHAEGVAILFGMRSGSDRIDRARRAADDRRRPGSTRRRSGRAAPPLDRQRRSATTMAARIVDTTAGNPLALIDLGQELSAAELSGAAAVHDPIPLGEQLAAATIADRLDGARRVDTRTWLLARRRRAVGETTHGRPAAARALGIDPGAATTPRRPASWSIRSAGAVSSSARPVGACTAARRPANGGTCTRRSPRSPRRVDRSPPARLAPGGRGHGRRRRARRMSSNDAPTRPVSRGGRETVRDVADACGRTDGCRRCAERDGSCRPPTSVFADGSLVQAEALLDRCADRRPRRRRVAGRALALRARIDVRPGEPNAERDAAVRCLEAAATVRWRTIAGRAALLAACEHAVMAAEFAGAGRASRDVADVDRAKLVAPNEPDPVLDGLLAGVRWRSSRIGGSTPSTTSARRPTRSTTTRSAGCRHVTTR